MATVIPAVMVAATAVTVAAVGTAMAADIADRTVGTAAVGDRAIPVGTDARVAAVITGVVATRDTN